MRHFHLDSSLALFSVDEEEGVRSLDGLVDMIDMALDIDGTIPWLTIMRMRCSHGSSAAKIERYSSRSSSFNL
jgi:hypothetical protein